MLRENLSYLVDAFHVVWVIFWIGLVPASYRWRKASVGLQVVTWSTLTTQAVFLGCPLTMLSAALRGADYQGSATGAILRRFRIEVPAEAIAISTVMIWVLAAYGTWRFFRTGRSEKEAAC